MWYLYTSLTELKHPAFFSAWDSISLWLTHDALRPGHMIEQLETGHLTVCLNAFFKLNNLYCVIKLNWRGPSMRQMWQRKTQSSMTDCGQMSQWTLVSAVNHDWWSRCNRRDNSIHISRLQIEPPCLDRHLSCTQATLRHGNCCHCNFFYCS